MSLLMHVIHPPVVMLDAIKWGYKGWKFFRPATESQSEIEPPANQIVIPVPRDAGMRVTVTIEKLG